MSAQATAHVWKHGHGFSHSTKLLLLAIADVVNDTYDNRLFMAPDKLRAKADDLPERTFRRSVAQLLKAGWLRKIGPAPGPGGFQEYQFQFVLVSHAKVAPLVDANLAKSHAKVASTRVPKPAKQEPRTSSLNPRRDPKEDPNSAPSPAKARERDLLFEAICEECNIEGSELTKSARGEVNNACAQLRAVAATPDELRVRARRYRQRFQRMALTPSALVKHWPKLGVDLALVPAGAPGGRSAVSDAALAAVGIEWGAR